MIEWFKKLLHIVDYYASDRQAMQHAIALLENANKRLLNEMASIDRRVAAADVHALVMSKTLKSMVDTSVDVHPHDGYSHVIVAGRFKNSDYVNSFVIRHEDLYGLVNQLKDMQRFSTVKHIDAPVELRRVIARELMP